MYLGFALEYKIKQSKIGKFPSHYKLAQSILKRKFPSVLKPLQNKTLKKRAFEKYKPRGLFSEFYGIGNASNEPDTVGQIYTLQFVCRRNRQFTRN